MIVLFTEEEREYIDKKLFRWEVADDCPEELRAEIERKLKLIYKEEEQS